jgi:SAM-dependent methyltransferase
VLDLACGTGRHLRLFLAAGHPVVGIDRDLERVRDLGAVAGVELIERDLETGDDPGLGEASFEGIVVTNYLVRPLFPALLAALAPGGVLIYETFAQGNERFGRPRNPDFLLAPGELRERTRGLEELAYEHGEVERADGGRAVVQRICARRPTPDSEAASRSAPTRA